MKLTTEQAIKILLGLRNFSRIKEQNKALQMGADALALQEPKKPREDTFGWYCPICNHYFDPRAWKSAYCGRCGQKLNWESDN